MIKEKTAEEIHDCLGRMACIGNACTGFVETLYKGCKTSTRLAIGEVFTVERQGVITRITRSSSDSFKVDSYIKE